MMMLRLEQVRRFGSLQRSVRIATRIEVLKNGGSGLFIRGFSSEASSFENNHGPLAVYKRRVEKNLVSQDPLQLEALNHFERLHHECIDYEKAFQQLKQTTFTSPTPTVEGDSTKEEGGWWFSLWSSSTATIAEALPRKPSTTPKSLYLWGSTGCGKTYLMDLFFENLPIKLKKRIHFHDFMIDIHKRLHALKNNNNTSSSHTTEKSLQKIANQIMEESILICFDEFQVTDIADAMLLRLLFEELFQQGLILIATSNRPPTELYKNGIQRDLFIPFIHLLEEKSDIFSFIPKDHVKIDQSTIVKDYRLVKYQHLAKNIYFFPIDSVNESAILKQFDEYCPSYSTINFFDHLMIPSTYTADLTVFGHIFHVPSIIHGRRVAKFTFQDICNRAYGAADFIALSKVFHVICLVNVPKLSTNSRDEMRRFITLVDAVYESKSLLLILADSNPMQLLNIDEEQRKTAVYDEVFAFDRTVSRLLEMQSTDYVKAALEAFPQGQDFLATVLTELKIRSKQDRHVSSSHMQSASHPHFHNDHNSMLWVLRKVWSHYRLGTVGELKAALTMTSNLEGLLNISNLSLAAENKQTMERDTFLIMLGDIVDYYFRDMQGNELKQKMIIDALSQIQNKHKGEYISFSHYVSTVLELIELIHR